MRILLVRHGATEGNLARRYVGRTDEPLCAQGVEKLAGKKKKHVSTVYVSPLLRARQTADILFPNAQKIPVEGLREMDFGDFEMKNYRELAGNKEYQIWVDSCCEGQVPNGERKREFTSRSCSAFEDVVADAIAKGQDEIAVVAHGGTLMSILSEFAVPQKEYFTYKTPNGECWRVQLCEKQWNSSKIIHIEQGPKED